MTLDRIDVDDDADFLAWCGPQHACEKLEFPDDPGWLPVELRERARNTSTQSSELYVMRDRAGAPLATLWIRFTLRENLRMGELEPLIVPDQRGKGCGRELLEFGEQMIRSDGRDTAITYSIAPVPITASAERDRRFAVAAGYEAGQRCTRLCLPVTVGMERADALEQAARPLSASKYRIVRWIAHCPDEFAKGRAALGAGMSTDAPSDDLSLEAEAWDVPRVRELEDVIARMDRDLYGAGAVEEPSGDLVALTEISVPRTEPVVAHQSDTIVGREHRGHRLGALVKIVNLRALVAGSPGTKRIYTWNADSNDPMIKVNETMGFEACATGRIWQKTLA